MQTPTWRLALVGLVAIVLAACSRPLPPTLSELAGDTAALSSFVSLVEALEIDLDAATDDGQYTVFAPSNDLLDKYAVAFGFVDAADMVTELETAPATLRTAVIRFVAAHIVDYQPGLLTKDFITHDITDTDEWSTYYCYQGDCNGYFELYWYSGYETPADAYHSFLFTSRALGVADDAWVVALFEEPVFVAADVEFSNGIVHVMNGTIKAGSLDYIAAPSFAD
jgi:hypothetical protein